MKSLFTTLELENASLYDKLPCQCYQCNEVFYTKKHTIMYAIRGQRDYAKFCSRECKSLSESKSKICECATCHKEFKKAQSQIKKTKYNFCSKSCSAIYRNSHKTYGTRRSKLEKYIEEELTKKYNTLEIDYNKKDVINSELDIFIPKFKLAFELNGIFHYEPIYGVQKLLNTQFNDTRKFKACIENGISLCIIDVSSIKNFKPHKALGVLNIITNIIDENINIFMDEK